MELSGFQRFVTIIVGGIVALWLVPELYYVIPSPRCDALFAAVKKNDAAEVQRLLASGVNPNCRDNNYYRFCTGGGVRPGTTPLMYALSRGYWTGGLGHHMHKMDIKITKLLLEAGADPNSKSRGGSTALSAVCSQWDVDKKEHLDLLFQSGARLGIGKSPLPDAAYRGHLDLVNILLDHGADINAKDELGFTALARATSFQNHPEIAKLLIERGAEVNTHDKFGRTPLHGALEYGNIDSVSLLRKQSAKE